MARSWCVLCCALLWRAAADLQQTQMSPVAKVVKLVQEMKVQTEKDAESDKENFDKYMCWCDTNKVAKKQAIKSAIQQIDELTIFTREAAAKEGELKTGIDTLDRDIAEDKSALEQATQVREKDAAEFAAEEADLTETADLLGKSVDILGKVQFIQKASTTQKAVLLQTKERVLRTHPEFSAIMERDLFDVMGSMPLRRKPALLSKSTQPKGAVAGAKSYNSQSGQIFGVLGGMKDKALSDLDSATKAEQNAIAQFTKLREAKIGEISASTEESDQKKADLADIMDKAAKAKEDIAALQETQAADEKFLSNLLSSCQHEDEEYQKRSKIRSEEIRALGETLKILTDDESRELFGKTISFTQTDKINSRASTALHKISKIALKRREFSLLASALKGRVSNDKFDQVVKMVSEAMEKMLKQMAEQKAAEHAKLEACKKGLSEVEEQLADANEVKENLDEQHANIENGIAKLTEEIEGLKKEIANMQVSLKQASEDRKAANEVFQTSISDNRATIMILGKALNRLKAFYQPKASALVEVGAHQEPPPPPSSKGYSKSAGAGGVLQMLTSIITEAEQEGIELVADEKAEQQRYAELVVDTKESIEAANLAIQEKSVAKTKLEGDKSETQESQIANAQEIDSFQKTLDAHHLDCDFLLKWGPMREQALEQEMEATQDAEATLHGADMGR